MEKSDNPMFGSSAEGEAIVEYLDAEFSVVKPGAYVRCSVTGVRIPLDHLKYWNVDKQEAYADAEAAAVGFDLRRVS